MKAELVQLQKPLLEFKKVLSNQNSEITRGELENLTIDNSQEDIKESKMSKLYGISAEDQILMPLLQHRAVLFSLVDVACVYAAHNASARWPVLIGAIISMASFIAIAVSRGTTAGALNKIIIVDAVGLLIAAVLIFLLAKG